MTCEQIADLRTHYPAGTRVQLGAMDDTQAPPAGTQGTVREVDDAGSIHVQWDTGSNLALIPNEDRFTIVA